MGNARFYYYPYPSGNYLEQIDLEESLSELFSDYEIDAQDGVSYTGRRFRTVSKILEVVRIQRDRMKGSEDLAAQLMSLQSHLDRGYPVLFSADSSKSWVAYLAQDAAAGDLTITVSRNQMKTIVGQNIVSAGDYVMIESQNPAMRYQMLKVASLTATANNSGTITFTTPILFKFDSGKAAVRYYRFWPTLKRPQSNLGTNMITNERGFLFSLDVTLIPDYEEYFDLITPFDGEKEDSSSGDAFSTNTSDSVLGLGGLIQFNDPTGGGSSIGTSLITEPEVEGSIEDNLP